MQAVHLLLLGTSLNPTPKALPDAGWHFRVGSGDAILELQDVLVQLQLLEEVIVHSLFGHVELNHPFHAHLLERVDDVVVRILIRNAIQRLE